MTAPRFRFAPSPTGRIHVGNLRQAVVNKLAALAMGGTLLLRLDDTDRERSREEYAEGIKRDLIWLGITWDDFARQSDRLASYEAAAERLKSSGRLYPCYETSEELALKRKSQLAAGRPPRYDRAALALTDAEKSRFEAEGRRAHWRFRLEDEAVEFTDHVHGHHRFAPESMSDPVVIREDGAPLFILSGVVDDIELGVTHIIRGEDHISNTAVQLQIFRALGGPIPEFAHLSLLVDADGGKLSKRLGSLSVENLRADGVEPMAIVAYLSRLGSSLPIEPVADWAALAEGFSLERFSRAAPRFDADELKRLSARWLHQASHAAIHPRLATLGIPDPGEAFWLAARGNLNKLSELDSWRHIVEGPIQPLLDDPGFAAQAAQLLPADPWSEATWSAWTGAVKSATGRSGKALFLPLRRALTGRDDGPEMKTLLPWIGRARAMLRLSGKEA